MQASSSSAPATVETKYLALKPSASVDAVGPGGRFTLVLDVVPKPKIHVYAPGQPDYIPISLTLDADPAYRVAAEARYPKPQVLFFKPLNERFKVYSAPFRISQDVILAETLAVRARAATADTTLVVRGKVAYQACDDLICYLPVEASVSWPLRLKTASDR
jgi:DsbC/DsbD-like thiol-disulfide interchange protein